MLSVSDLAWRRGETVQRIRNRVIETMKDVAEKQVGLARMRGVSPACVVFRQPILFLFEIRFAIG
jgi:hypothetical protein